MLHVVLYQPEIPPNTGNISRQCVGMKARLHIISPAGFDMSSAAVRRAGLDHWESLDLTVHDSPSRFLDWLGNRRPWLVTKRGLFRYDVPAYSDGDVLVFGSETRGLPGDWLHQWHDRTVHIPILGDVRSYNLANSVGIVLAQASLGAGMFEVRKRGSGEV